MKRSTAGTVISLTNNLQISPVFPLPLLSLSLVLFLSPFLSLLSLLPLLLHLFLHQFPFRSFPFPTLQFLCQQLKRVPLQWFPTAEESPARVSLGPSSPAETLIQPQECFNTPISVGSVQRRRASNSARLGEELRAQTEHEQLKLDHTKRILQLKLEKESEILELRLHNERERNRVGLDSLTSAILLRRKSRNGATLHPSYSQNCALLVAPFPYSLNKAQTRGKIMVTSP
ncbi:unnamed protein product [Timema podura]|uniref:Uncharacterized protein n=1 Tax=Timema podura TaxID=61482 RepID=A0ABN7PE96_TIMPD|nr:unnamed protein product [Timema podura]